MNTLIPIAVNFTIWGIATTILAYQLNLSVPLCLTAMVLYNIKLTAKD